MSEQSRLTRIVGWTLVVGVVALVSFYSYFTSAKPPRDAVFRYSTAEYTVLQYALILGFVLVAAAGTRWRDFFALRRPSSWRAAAGIAVAVFAVVMALNFALEPVLHAGRDQGLTPHGWRHGRGGAFAANLVAFGLVGPFVEEVTFRGEGYALFERYGRWLAIGVVGVAFGLWHGIPAALPVLVAFGVGLAYLRSRTASVYPGLVLHSVFNVLALVVGVLT